MEFSIKNPFIRIAIISIVILILILLYNILFKENASFEKEFVNLQKVSEFGNSLGMPGKIMLLDSTIIIIDYKPLPGFPYIQTYGSDTKYIRSYGKQGQGPNEMLDPWKVFPDPVSKNKFWIYDVILHRVTKFSLDSTVTNKYITLEGAMSYNPVLLENGLIISPGFGLTKGRLAVYDTTGKMLKIIGEIPPGIKENVPVPVHQVAYQSILKVKPDGSFLVLAVRYADMLELYRTDGILVKRIHGPFNREPVYSVDILNGSPVMAIDTKNSIIGYIDIALTNKYIYALFSGRTIDEYHEKAAYGNYIHVFDWNGDILSIYKSDSDLLSIAVNSDESLLYAIQYYPKVSIVVYSLR